MEKSFRYAYPRWREKEIVSESKRLQGLCPLTPEETSLVLRALGFEKTTRIYIASGEIYGGNRRLAALRASFPQLVRYFCTFHICYSWGPLFNYSSDAADKLYLAYVQQVMVTPKKATNKIELNPLNQTQVCAVGLLSFQNGVGIELQDVNLDLNLVWFG